MIEPSPLSPPPGRANVKLLIFVLYIFYINISIFFLQNQFINGRGCGRYMELPCGGAPPLPNLPPFHPPSPPCQTAVRWGYRGYIPTPFV